MYIVYKLMHRSVVFSYVNRLSLNFKQFLIVFVRSSYWLKVQEDTQVYIQICIILKIVTLPNDLSTCSIGSLISKVAVGN